MATHKDLRRALAYALNDLEVMLVVTATNAAVTCLGLVNLAANASTNRYNGAYLYPVNRRVQTGGYTPATGTLTYDFTSTVLTGGTELEITRLFPAATAEQVGAGTAYQALLNKALARYLVPDRLGVTITTANSIALAPYAAWLDRPDRLVRVLEPPPVGTRPLDAAWRGWHLVLDGGTPSLELDAPFSAAVGNLTLEVLRPANTLVNGAESTVGLAANTDAVPAQAEDVVVLALLEAYQDLMSRAPGQPGGDYAQKYQNARERAEQLFYFDGAFYRPKAMAPPQPAAA